MAEVFEFGPLRSDCAEASTKLFEQPKVAQAIQFIEIDQPNRIKDQVELTECAAPPFKEEKRGELFAGMLQKAGLNEVRIDGTGNVIARRKGSGSGPTLVVAAHLDSVFPEGTPIKVREENGVYYAPGISDDTGGLANLLQVVKALNKYEIETEGDIVFVGTVGEEGNGDLRGAKALWREKNDYDGFIAIDSAAPTRILKGSVGCKRYRVKFSSPGGHSLHKFGIVASPIHALCRAGALLDNVVAPTDPKCTFNIGVVKGGTSVNAIATNAEFELDIRAMNQEALENFTAKILPLFEQAVKECNEKWGVTEENSVKLEIVQIGDRPAGINKPNSPVVHAAYAAMQKVGIELKKFGFAATDQNVPLAMGVPATTLGAGGSEDFNHSVKESWNSKDAFLGPQLSFLTALILVGMKGVTKPVLGKR